MPGPVAALSVPAPFGLEAALEAEGVESLQRRVRHQVDRAAVSPGPSVGPAARDELLPAEAHAAVASVSPDHDDLGLINQHVTPVPAKPLRSPTTGDAARRIEWRERRVRDLPEAFRPGRVS